MINIPELVKDALREGAYKKNYRFNVGFFGEGYVDLVTLSPNISLTFDNRYTNVRQYKFYKNVANAFDSITIEITDGGTTTTETIAAEVVGNQTYALFDSSPYSDFASFSVNPGNVEGMIMAEYSSDTWNTEYTIDNNNLVAESVKFDERMCSGNTLKFGLCEGTSLEFQYFDKPDILDKQLQAIIDVQYEDSNGDLQWHSIPMGFFTVEKCPTQFSTGIKKVTAYNKLMSDYLDEKANDDILRIFKTGDIYVDDILRVMLDEYAIKARTYTRIEPTRITGQSGYTIANVSGTFKFTTYKGDNTPFNAHMFAATTSDNCFIKMQCECYQYTVNPNYPIKLQFAFDMDSLDDAIYSMIEDSIDAAHLSVTTATLMQRIVNMPGATSRGSTIFTNYGFQIVLIFNDNTQRVYGKTLYDNGLAYGTFQDLAYRTIQNVKSVLFVFPTMLRGAKSGYTATNIIHFEGTIDGNIMEHNYEYYDSNDVLQRVNYAPPTSTEGIFVYTNLPNHVAVSRVGSLSPIDMLEVDVETMPDVTLRELQSAIYETKCQYGQLDRETDLFSGVELNRTRLVPADTLYPANDLYPGGTSERGDKSAYSKLWAQKNNVQSFRYLIITYKGLNSQGEETDYTVQRTVNTEGTVNYNMSDNWLFRNLVWAKEDVEAYADAMVLKMRGITWFPFEMWAAGLPYLETGDEIEIVDSDNVTHTSYVLERQLSGIQNLQDTYINGTLDTF